MKRIKQFFWMSLCISSLILGLLDIALAEEKEDLKFNLEQIVITATKTPKQMKNVPTTVEVITAEDMKKKNVKRISDVLKLLPGIYVREPKGLMGSASTETISIRGFINDNYQGEQYVVFLMDGQPLNLNDTVNLSNIPIETIERIEVIKGASSALYGSNAMGGVINIISKEAPENATTVKMTVGEMGTKIGSISNSGSAGKLDYFLYAKNTASNGYPDDPTYLTAPPNSLQAKYPGKTGMDSESYNARFIYHFDDQSKFHISASRNNHSYFYENKPDTTNRDETSWALSYENKLDERHLLKVSYAEKEEEKNSVMSLSSSYRGEIYTVKSKQIEVQDNYQVSPKDLLTVGYVYKDEKMDNFKTQLNKASQGKDWNKTIPTSDSQYVGKTKNQAIYLQNEHRFDDQFTLYLGMRYDDWTFQDASKQEYINNKKTNTHIPDIKASNFSPKVALTYQPNTRLTLRTSIGKGFRAPSVRELIGGIESAQIRYLSNPNLEPEESTNYELGADYQFNKNLLGKITFFTTDVDNRITSVKTTHDNTINKDIVQMINTDKSKIQGVELGLNKRWDDRWTGFINYTYTNAKVKKNAKAPEIEGNQIDYVPKNMFNFGLNYEQNHWQANITGNYISDPCEDRGKTVTGRWDSYFVMDLKISYNFNPDTQLSLSIDNILDREYFSILLAQPRTTYLEFSQKF